jgi:hypothetical protein
MAREDSGRAKVFKYPPGIAGLHPAPRFGITPKSVLQVYLAVVAEGLRGHDQYSTIRMGPPYT